MNTTFDTFNDYCQWDREANKAFLSDIFSNDNGWNKEATENVAEIEAAGDETVTDDVAVYETETEEVTVHETETEAVAGDTMKKRVYSYNLDEVPTEEEYFSEHSSEEDSDYHKEIGSEEESEEGEKCDLEAEDMAVEAESEFMPEYNQIVQDTFDCTEVNPVHQNSTNWTSDASLLVGQEFPTIYKCR